MQESKRFTLIELLIVIAMTGILSSLLIPGLHNVRDNARTRSCISNYRQIGIALAQYTKENEHTFPGPIFTGVKAAYRSDSRNLTRHLAVYLGHPPPTNAGHDSAHIVQVLLCPGFDGTVNYLTPEQAIQHQTVGSYAKSKMSRFWGYPDTASVPKKVDLVEDSSSTVGMREIDYVNMPGWVKCSPDVRHGYKSGKALRVKLFFDHHAEVIAEAP